MAAKHTESSRVESSQVKSSQVESSQVESSQVKSSQGKSSQVKSAKSAKQTPAIQMNNSTFKDGLSETFYAGNEDGGMMTNRCHCHFKLI